MSVSVVYWSGTGNTEAMAQEVEQGMKDAGAEERILNEFQTSVWLLE